jgi:hypothetical protein
MDEARAGVAWVSRHVRDGERRVRLAVVGAAPQHLAAAHCDHSQDRCTTTKIKAAKKKTTKKASTWQRCTAAHAATRLSSTPKNTPLGCCLSRPRFPTNSLSVPNICSTGVIAGAAPGHNGRADTSGGGRK